MGEYFNSDYTFVIIIGIIILMLIVVYLIRKYLKIVTTLYSILKLVFDYFYVILIPIPLVFILYYYLFFDASKPETHIFKSIELIKDLKKLSFWFFTAGVFSAATKLISNLVIFKKQFKSIVMSEEFDELLTKKLEIITFSNDNLNRQSNLDEIWKRVTLCKYEKSFPSLMTKLHKNIENELFVENNLNSYFKNLRILVKFELLEDDILKITEISSCTIVTNTTDAIDVEFFVTSHQNDTEKYFTNIDPLKTKINGIPFDEDTFKDIIPIVEGEYFKKIFKYQLKDDTEYHIERYIVMQQDINLDRIYSFSSSKIIDDISIQLQYCEKLNVTFSSVGKNVFKTDNIPFDGQTYVNRDILMPGEKFKVFVFKK